MSAANRISTTPQHDELARLRARIEQLERENASRQRVEQAVAATEERYRRLIEGVRLIAWEFDRASRQFTFVSHHALDILGYPMEKWREPAFWYNHLHPDDREHAARYCRDHADRCENHELEYRMIRADGRVVWIRDMTTVVLTDGRPVGLQGVFIDITERKDVEFALRESEQRFRTIAESSSVGFWQITPEGHTIYINPAMCRVLEVDDARQMEGTTFHSFFTPASLERVKAEHAKRVQGIASTYEVEVVGRNGTHRTLTLSGAPLMAPDGQMHSLIGTFIDITERKAAEDARRQSIELQRMMLSELDHRVRNNLASLAALVDISMRDKKTVAAFAESIRRRVQAMSAVHSLLSRGHWVSVGLRTLVETLTPHDLRERLIIDSGDIGESAGDFDLVISPRQATALGMVVQELMANSIKYGALQTTTGRIHLRWRSTRRPQDHSHNTLLELQWRESGGPPIETQPRPGQGTELIQGFVRTELRGEVHLSYPRTGAFHTFALTLDPASESAGPPVRE